MGGRRDLLVYISKIKIKRGRGADGREERSSCLNMYTYFLFFFNKIKKGGADGRVPPALSGESAAGP